MEIKIRKIGQGDKPWVKKLFKTRWGSDFVVTRGEVHYCNKLSGFVAEVSGENKGLITYKIKDKELEIVSLDSLMEGKGIGTRLINEVIEFAREVKARRIWLITTNDNVDAVKFYQRRGFRIKDVYPGAIDMSRKLKSSIPEIGNYGIPIRDEIELEVKLKNEPLFIN